MTALGVEFADELADGTKGAVMPLIRTDLGLSYAQIGLLFAVPLLVGSLLELPLGLVAGYGRRRRRLTLAGGLVFVAALATTATAGSFWALLAALTVFFPASGAFVSLTQSALMDAAPDRQERHMAAWNLTGSLGAVAGPLLLAGCLLAGGSWRLAYLLVAALAAVALAGHAVAGHEPVPGPGSGHGSGPGSGPEPGPASGPEPGSGPEPEPGAGPEPGSASGPGSGLRAALRALRDPGVARWLVLLQVGDLMLDVLTGFVAVYLVDAVHASPAQAAVAVAVRLGAGLAGDAGTLMLLRWVPGQRLLRVSALIALPLYLAFLLVPGLLGKIVILAALSLATASWYPLQQAGLYAALPGRSGIAVFLGSAAALAGALGPLAVGFAAARFGLTTALACLVAAPIAVLTLTSGRPATHG